MAAFTYYIAAILLILLPAVTFSDIASDRAALLALRSAVGGRSNLWNISEPNICVWAGVACSRDHSTVVELHLPGVGLSGVVPPNTIANLTNLQTLSLRYNALVSPLPSDLGKLTNLRNLYLQHNLFNESIPDFLFSFINLVRLNLAMNSFSGPITTSFNNLTRLGTLYLEENQLSGPLPDLNIPGLVQFNVSNNNLTGPIPKAIAVKNPKSAFVGTSLCGQPLNDLCDNGVGHDGGKKKKKKLSGGAIAGIVIGCVVGVLLILLLLLCLCKKRGNKNAAPVASKSVEAGVKETAVEIPREKSVESVERDGLGGGFAAIGAKMKDKEKVEGGNVGGKSLVFFGKTPKAFDLDDLLKASAEVLGKGTFGTAYKAGLETGITVAVKRLRDVVVSEKEFREKMDGIGKMDHANLVPLLAYYYNREEKLLVYEYMPMGSLSALLHGNKGSSRTPLNWETRANIALGAARGITYLHSQGSSHGNVKASNILLTTTYQARVSDFGLAPLVSPTPTPNRVAGYRAPEVTDARKVSQKADVYSFGVLLLELLTGRAPTHALANEEGVDLPRWVQSVVREEWTNEVFDLELLRYQNVEEDMVQLLQLGIDCTDNYPDKRPSMPEVTEKIEELCRTFNSQDSTGIMEDA
ncbi:OLC1v1011564C1 [Oldenlandia corymbosa var. corymbosa]|uniref:OLC1v1011564C1 n=1 Tax=Oldenlandia corymbosa var. corymbosa TaxID=529605 RepID=A0AAV1DWY6_OLDCO|nr:OLC1v1011564C1 [Oldenlandia corymbosa var. corymbosa]